MLCAYTHMTLTTLVNSSLQPCYYNIIPALVDKISSHAGWWVCTPLSGVWWTYCPDAGPIGACSTNWYADNVYHRVGMFLEAILCAIEYIIIFKFQLDLYISFYYCFTIFILDNA